MEKQGGRGGKRKVEDVGVGWSWVEVECSGDVGEEDSWVRRVGKV